MSSPATPALRRVPLPEGTLPVGAALLIAGVATYAFFKVGEVALGEEAFKPIVALWFATFALAPGFFLPLEQELGRALSHRKAMGQGGRPVVRRVVILGSAITGIVLVAMLIASPQITTHYFDGDWWMMAALTTAFVSYAPAHLARGVCAGTGRFRSYAFVMGSDGVIRIVACVVLAVLGIDSPAPYAFAVALSPLVAVVTVGIRGELRTQPGPDAVSYSPASPCSCSKPCRLRCSPDCRAWRPATSSTSSATASARSCSSWSPSASSARREHS